MKKAGRQPDTRVGALLYLLNKQNKGAKVYRASETEDASRLRRPTGIASLDMALAGGAPAGGIIQVDGQEGVGKDALLNCYIRMNQLLYGERSCVFVGYTEPLGWDKLWARRMGVRVPLSEMEIDNYEYALGAKLGKDMREDLQSCTGEMLFYHSVCAEDMFERLLIAARSNVCQLLILDSIEPLLPKDFLERKVKAGEQSPDTQIEGGGGLDKAKSETEFTAKFTNACIQLGLQLEKPTLILVGQARANLAASRGPMAWMAKKWETNKHGSHARRHFNTMDLQLQSIGKLPLQGEPKVGKRIKWELTKAKRGTHDGKHGEYTLYFDSGPDVIGDLLETLRTMDLVTQSGSRTHIVDPQGNVLAEGAGVPDIMTQMRTDPELWLSAYRMLLATLPDPIILGPKEV